MINHGKPLGRALVAGGAGFIGSHLCDALLAEGCSVLVVDNFCTGRIENLRHLEREPRFEHHRCRRDRPHAASRCGAIDTIFNLACAASPPHYQADPVHTMLTSVLGTRNLLALAERPARASSSPPPARSTAIPRSIRRPRATWGNVNPTGPRACYDEGKRAAETLCFDYQRAGRVDVRVARIFNTYGPRMRADDGRVVSNMITQALGAEDITIYGDGSQTRSFCYVDDLVDGLMRLAVYDGPTRSPLNLGNPVEITIAELAGKVLALTGSRSRVVEKPLPVDDPRRRRPDITLAQEVLGWSPRVPLKAGLTQTISWFATRPAANGTRTPAAAKLSEIGERGARGSAASGPPPLA